MTRSEMMTDLFRFLPVLLAVLFILLSVGCKDDCARERATCYHVVERDGELELVQLAALNCEERSCVVRYTKDRPVYMTSHNVHWEPDGGRFGVTEGKVVSVGSQAELTTVEPNRFGGLTVSYQRKSEQN